MAAANRRELFAPGRLWSLWEMLEKFGAVWSTAIIHLEESKWLWVGLFSKAQIGHPQTELIPLDRSGVEGATRHSLVLIRQACILTDLDAILPELDRLEQAIWPVHPGTPLTGPDGIATAITHLLSRLQDELRAEYFFHLDQRDVPFYLNAESFGPLVTKKFPKATEDISEAGKCLALQRSTACVFHLMRTLELAVQAFGKKLRVKIDVNIERWQKILDHVDGAIKLLPAKTAKDKRRKAELAAASVNLNHVRIAWRNESMHPKQTYTRQEALDIFNATRVFMSSLARVI